MFASPFALVGIMAALATAVLSLVFRPPTPCPDDPSRPTAGMLPELAEMTPEQQETLQIEWSEDDNEKAAVWNRNRDWIRTAVLTPLGRRTADERGGVLLHGPPPQPAR